MDVDRAIIIRHYVNLRKPSFQALVVLVTGMLLLSAGWVNICPD